MPPHHTAAICGHEVSYDQVNAQVRLRQPLRGPWDDQALRLDEVVEGSVGEVPQASHVGSVEGFPCELPEQSTGK